jgi:hypothetical protein
MTLNQKYKKSKSDLPFKDWVYQQQKIGKLDFNDEHFDIVSEKEDSQISVGGIPLSYIGISIVLIVGALYIIPKLRK